MNLKSRSSIPLRTPSDYQDMDALNLDFSTVLSNKEVSLSVDKLRQCNKKRRQRMWLKLHVLTKKKILVDKKQTINIGDTYWHDQNDQLRLKYAANI